MLRVVRLSHLAVVAALGSSYACSGAPGEGFDRTESTRKTSDSIIGGSRANAYEESALVSMLQGGQVAAYCSASVVARMGFSVFGSPSRRRRTTLSWLLPRTPQAPRRIAAARRASFFKMATPRRRQRRYPSHRARASRGRPVPAASAPGRRSVRSESPLRRPRRSGGASGPNSRRLRIS